MRCVCAVSPCNPHGTVRLDIYRLCVTCPSRCCRIPGVDLRDDEVEAVRLQFLQEMEILSFLRHPNLLLFIGVSFDPSTRTPLWIITELMQHSVYSLLHEMRLELTVSEIVDISLGVVSGLQVSLLWGRCIVFMLARRTPPFTFLSFITIAPFSCTSLTRWTSTCMSTTRPSFTATSPRRTSCLTVHA